MKEITEHLIEYVILNNGRPVPSFLGPYTLHAESPEAAVTLFKGVHAMTAETHHRSIKLGHVSAIAIDQYHLTSIVSPITKQKL